MEGWSRQKARRAPGQKARYSTLWMYVAEKCLTFDVRCNSDHEILYGCWRLWRKQAAYQNSTDSVDGLQSFIFVVVLKEANSDRQAWMLQGFWGQFVKFTLEYVFM